MAYMSQDNKKRIEKLVKPILTKYGVKGRLGVHHHSELVLNITAGTIDFASECKYEGNKDAIQVNQYHLENGFTGKALEFLKEVKEAMYNGNHDNSDIMTDYWDIGWFVSINIGRWDKPYVLIK